MKCPKCHREVSDPITTCSNCGFAVSDDDKEKLFSFFQLKNEILNLHTIGESLQNGLNRVNSKIEQYEETLAEEIQSKIKPEPALSAGLYSVPETKQMRDQSGADESPLDVKTAVLPVPNASARQNRQDTSQFEVRVGQKWLLIIGIITMVFGIGYFLKYSFEQGWVGPAGRVAMAYFWGILFLFAGNMFCKRKFEGFGFSLIGGGIATLYFAALAGFQIYHLFGQTSSFLIMVLITLLASVLSITYNTKWLAMLGLIGGFFTPIMLSTGQDNQIFLMSYMVILNAGILAVAFYKKWDILNILGFVFTYVLYTGWFANHYSASKFWPAVLFLTGFYLIYTFIPLIYNFMRVNAERKGFFIITPNSFIAFGFSYYMIQNRFSIEWVSVVTIFYALTFLSTATYLHLKNLHRKEAFLILLGKATMFLIITVPIIFSKHWITVFWAAQAGVLLWMGLRLNSKGLIGGAYGLLFIAIAKFLAYDYEFIFRLSLINISIRPDYLHMLSERLLTSVFLLGSLLVFARMLKKVSLNKVSNSFDPKKEAPLLSVICGIMVFVVLNVEVSAFFHDYMLPARFAAISVLWTIFSAVLMIRGFKINSTVLRKVSLWLFFITLFKVFAYDISNIQTPYRILSFMILGVMMIGVSYLYHRYKEKILQAFAAGKDGSK